MRTSVDALKAMIRDLEDKPKDSSYDEEIKELKREEAALLTVLQEIGKKNIFNFLSDEGLLPNYAFLKQVLFFGQFFIVRRMRKHRLRRKI